MGASITLSAFFTSGGTPIPGLPVTVTIQNLTDNVTEVSAGATVDQSNGFYTFLFANLDVNKVYTVIFDGGITLDDSERYITSTLPGSPETVTGDSGNPSLSFSKVGMAYQLFYQATDFNTGLTIMATVLDDTNTQIIGSPLMMNEINPPSGIYSIGFTPSMTGIYKVIITEEGTKKAFGSIEIVTHDLDTIGATVDGISTSPGFSSGGYIL